MSKPFFELRIYKVFPDKADEWLEFMEKTIVPFQRLKGMDIVGLVNKEGTPFDRQEWIFYQLTHQPYRS